jgi:uncharacterized OB-fold protein
MYRPDDYTLPVTYYPTQSEKGWQCPKCGNVYAPFMMECRKCNSADQFAKFSVTGKEQPK